MRLKPLSSGRSPTSPSPKPETVPTSIDLLTKWEDALRPWFDEIRLIGEIPITAQEVDEIGRLLREAGVDRIRKARLWDHTLLVYMVSIAVRNDEGHYWGVLADSLNARVTPYWEGQFGEFFERWQQEASGSAEQWQSLSPELYPSISEETGIVQYFYLSKLPTFSGPSRYVRLIRLHGGIPAYSLPDFFEQLVLPANNDPRYVGLAGRELISVLLDRPSVKYSVDSPVRYYLEHGGESAEDFFARCLDMAKRWKEQVLPPTAQALGLPRYVVQAFADFMEGQTRTAQGSRLRAPRLLLDPTSAGTLFSLALPQQPVDSNMATWQYTWRVRPIAEAGGVPVDDAEEIVEWVKIRRSGYDVITDEESLSLNLPPCQIQVVFEATSPEDESRQIGRWLLALTPAADLPLLAFRPSDGRPVRKDQTLPAENLWLLYPWETHIEVNGAGHCVQTFPRLLGAWSAWQIAEWNLDQTRNIWLEDEHGGRVGTPFSVQQGQSEARLIGENHLDGTLDPDDVPLFVGAPPTLWLPRMTGEDPHGEMAHWQIEITPSWATQPQLSRKNDTTLTQWAEQVTVSQGDFALPLAAILGRENVLGAFGINVRGPRSFRQELRFRIWSDLAIADLQECYVPGPQGAEPIHFHVNVAAEHRIVSPAGETGTGVASTDQPGQFRVTVAPNSLEAVLDLVAPRPNDDPVRVPLRLAVSRLRWIVRFNGDETVWQTSAPSLPVATLVQAPSKGILLDWGQIKEIPYARLMLDEEIDAHKPALKEEDLDPRKSGQRVYIDLTNFQDTIKYHQTSPLFTLFLSTFVNNASVNVPLLHLSQSLDVDAVMMGWDKVGQIHLYWSAPHRLRNRRVRLWSAWRPWEEAQEFVIPDQIAPGPQDSQGGGMVTLQTSLPPGWYRVAFRTAHNWEPLSAPSHPTADSLLSADVSAEDRLDTLAIRVRDGQDRAFEIHFEQACIYHCTDNHADRDREIQWLCRNVDKGDPIQVAALEHWLRPFDPNSARAVRMRMFRKELLEQLFQDSLPERVCEAYLDCFASAKTISGESAALVLSKTQRPDVVNRALEILLKPGMAETLVHTAATFILDQMNQGAFGDKDAEALLSADIDRTVDWLLAAAPSPARNRLLEALSQTTGNLVMARPGYWVRTEAGWGQIDAITREGQTQDHWIYGEPGVLLSITLRSGLADEQVEIETEARRIRFVNVAQVFRCTKEGCSGFVSQDRYLITEKHNHAAHQGIGPSSAPSKLEWNYRRMLQFAVHAPTELHS